MSMTSAESRGLSSDAEAYREELGSYHGAGGPASYVAKERD